MGAERLWEQKWVKEYRSTAQVWAREADDNTSVIRLGICFWKDGNIFVGVFNHGLLFEAYTC